MLINNSNAHHRNSVAASSAGAHRMSGFLSIDERRKGGLPRPGNLRVAPCSNRFGKVRQPLFEGNAEFQASFFYSLQLINGCQP